MKATNLRQILFFVNLEVQLTLSNQLFLKEKLIDPSWVRTLPLGIAAEAIIHKKCVLNILLYF